MNGSGHRGGAFGIKLESINKLADTKSEGATPTLLHYITKVVQQKFADLAYFLIELRPAEEAEKGLQLLCSASTFSIVNSLFIFHSGVI